ncbi:MAG TPA: hypothetical protein ACFE0H_05115 [Elainellaceae cyanobacterium]|jgi:hypothetical protein
MVANQKAVRQRVQFAFNADVDSVIGAVFQYLIKNRRFNSREGKRKGVDAMVAFYKPFAFQDSKDVTDDELQSMAQDAVEMLSRQIEILCGAFEVEHPGAIALDLKSEIREAIAEALNIQSIRVHNIPSDQTPDAVPDSHISTQVTDDDSDFDEDALLGDLCSNAEAVA